MPVSQSPTRVTSASRPKEPLLLISGMMCDERLWQHQVKFFAEYADIHIGDITTEPDIPGMAEKILAHLPWEIFSVAGLSMGGIIAMEMLRQAAHRIKRCALMGTNHLAETPVRKQLRAQEIQQAQSPGGLKKVMIEKMRPAYLSPKRKYEQAFLDLVLDMALKLGEEAFINQSLALRDRLDYSATIRSIKCPVLLLCGEWDMLCPPLRHQQMQRLLPPQTPVNLVIIKGSGHLTPLENANMTNQALARWLDIHTDAGDEK